MHHRILNLKHIRQWPVARIVTDIANRAEALGLPDGGYSKRHIYRIINQGRAHLPRRISLAAMSAGIRRYVTVNPDTPPEPARSPRMPLDGVSDLNILSQSRAAVSAGVRVPVPAFGRVSVARLLAEQDAHRASLLPTDAGTPPAPGTAGGSLLRQVDHALARYRRKVVRADGEGRWQLILTASRILKERMTAAGYAPTPSPTTYVYPHLRERPALLPVEPGIGGCAVP